MVYNKFNCDMCNEEIYLYQGVQAVHIAKRPTNLKVHKGFWFTFKHHNGTEYFTKTGDIEICRDCYYKIRDYIREKKDETVAQKSD